MADREPGSAEADPRPLSLEDLLARAEKSGHDFDQPSRDELIRKIEILENHIREWQAAFHLAEFDSIQFWDSLVASVLAGLALGDHFPHYDHPASHEAFTRLLAIQSKYQIKL